MVGLQADISHITYNLSHPLNPATRWEHALNRHGGAACSAGFSLEGRASFRDAK